MLPPGAGECRKTQAAGRDRGIRHPSVFRPMPLWADTMIVHQWYAVSRRVGIPQARKEPEQTFESVRTASFPSRHATTNTYRTGCGSFDPLAGRGISLTPILALPHKCLNRSLTAWKRSNRPRAAAHAAKTKPGGFGGNRPNGCRAGGAGCPKHKSPRDTLTGRLQPLPISTAQASDGLIKAFLAKRQLAQKTVVIKFA